MYRKNNRTTFIIALISLAIMASGCDDNTEKSKTSPKPSTIPTVKVSPSPTTTPSKLPTQTTTPTPATQPSAQQAIPVVSNHTSIEVMVNKQRALPANYVPTDLVQPNVSFSFSGVSEKKLLRSKAAKALEALFTQAKAEGINLNGVSGYRSYSTQSAIFNANVKRQGYEQARRFSALPGTSEHQTGLSIDVSAASVSNALEQSFGATVEGRWLATHCADFGFIIRYPDGKEAITGYAYEPWHIRYVGTAMASEIMSKGLTLEQYLGDAAPATIKQ
jgi:D-alanyl-D-alanine carboxypeptidase